MQPAAVLLARVLAYVESFDLNPQGKVFYPDLVAGIVEKFGFLKFPQKADEFDESKGVEFSLGKWGEVTVDTFRIYSNGLMLDTRVSTDVSEQVLLEGLAWVAATFGITYHPKMISRIGYLSQLSFYSDAPLLSGVRSPTSKLAERVHAAVSQISGDHTPWQPISLSLQSEPVPRKPVVAGFTIQRRAESSFSENKYFSEAPLSTELHNRLLTAFEADVVTASKQ